jgi:hypothetical protein
MNREPYLRRSKKSPSDDFKHTLKAGLLLFFLILLVGGGHDLWEWLK